MKAERIVLEPWVGKIKLSKGGLVKAMALVLSFALCIEAVPVFAKNIEIYEEYEASITVEETERLHEEKIASDRRRLREKRFEMLSRRDEARRRAEERGHAHLREEAVLFNTSAGTLDMIYGDNYRFDPNTGTLNLQYLHRLKV